MREVLDAVEDEGTRDHTTYNERECNVLELRYASCTHNAFFYILHLVGLALSIVRAVLFVVINQWLCSIAIKIY